MSHPKGGRAQLATLPQRRSGPGFGLRLAASHEAGKDRGGRPERRVCHATCLADRLGKGIPFDPEGFDE
jgi:hypothetical protein